MINLGLMDVDSGLHRFAPDAAASRGRRPARPAAPGGRGGGRSRRRLCPGNRRDRPPSTDLVCAAAARCRLIASPDDCLPRAPLSGAEALDLIRRGLDLAR